MKELTENPNIIVFIDELHTLVGAGSAEGSLDAANILKPALSRGEIRCIGATTPAEYRKYIEKDRSLERRFQAVKVDPPSEKETIQVLHGRQGSLRVVPPRRVHARGDRGGGLSVEPLHHRSVPARQGDRPHRRGRRARQAARGRDSAPRWARSAAASAWRSSRSTRPWASATARRPGSTREQEPQARESLQVVRERLDVKPGTPRIAIGKHEIDEVVSKWTGVPLTSVNEDESNKLLRMEDELHRRVISQEKAISALSRAIRRSRAGLKNPSRPVGSFIFLGPTGVGKTELARALAELPLRQRPRADPLRHVRVHGEALGVEADRLAARLRRARRGRSAHREDQAQSVLGRAARRDREGASRICSTSCCRSSRTVTSPTAWAIASTSRTRSSS